MESVAWLGLFLPGFMCYVHFLLQHLNQYQEVEGSTISVNTAQRLSQIIPRGAKVSFGQRQVNLRLRLRARGWCAVTIAVKGSYVILDDQGVSRVHDDDSSFRRSHPSTRTHTWNARWDRFGVVINFLVHESEYW